MKRIKEVKRCKRGFWKKGRYVPGGVYFPLFNEARGVTGRSFSGKKRQNGVMFVIRGAETFAQASAGTKEKGKGLPIYGFSFWQLDKSKRITRRRRMEKLHRGGEEGKKKSSTIDEQVCITPGQSYNKGRREGSSHS